MLIVYFLFYVGTLLLIIPGVKTRESVKKELLSKKDTNYIKGIAALGVFLSHSQNFLETNGKEDLILKPFSVLGGLGVLLFFFLGGYGIFKGYSDRKPTIMYWRNRIKKVFIPACLISFVSIAVINLTNNNIQTLSQYIYSVVMGQWYVDVVMIEYLIFFVSWYIACDKKELLIAIDIVGSVVVAIVLWKLGMNARWYNGLLLFPMGMLIANFEKKILNFSEKKNLFVIAVLFIGFCSSGVVFTMLKGTLCGDFIKTLSGICLSIAVLLLARKFEVGNRAMNWVGERSLFIYLCHLYLLSLISNQIQKKFLFDNHIEIWFYILLIGSALYAELSFTLFGKAKIKKQ